MRRKRFKPAPYEFHRLKGMYEGKRVTVLHKTTVLAEATIRNTGQIVTYDRVDPLLCVCVVRSGKERGEQIVAELAKIQFLDTVENQQQHRQNLRDFAERRLRKTNGAEAHHRSVCRRALRRYRRNGGRKQYHDFDRDYYDLEFASSPLQPKAPAWLGDWRKVSRYYQKPREQDRSEAQKLLAKLPAQK